jgi:heptosyltransferase-2
MPIKFSPSRLVSRALLRSLMAAQNIFFKFAIRASGKVLDERVPVDSVFVLRTGGVGDFLFALPAIKLIRQQFPQARVTLLVLASAQKSQRRKIDAYSQGDGPWPPWAHFVYPALVDQVVALAGTSPRVLRTQMKERLRHSERSLFFALTHPCEGFLSLLKKLVALRCMGHRGPVYGFRKQGTYSWRMLRALQKEIGLFKHKVWGPWESVLECARVSASGAPDMQLEMDVESAQAAQRTLAALKPSARLVGIAPGALMAHKQWPIEKYVELCRRLQGEDSRLHFLGLGTSADRVWCDVLERELPGSFLNLAGVGDMRFSAALAARCELFVTNDGGAAHLAALSLVPVVTIANGIEYANSVEPWGNERLSVRSEVPCAPCYSMTHCPRGDAICVKRVEVSAVYERCASELGVYRAHDDVIPQSSF